MVQHCEGITKWEFNNYLNLFNEQKMENCVTHTSKQCRNVNLTSRQGNEVDISMRNDNIYLQVQMNDTGS